jgi:hypothetical protein
MTGGVLRGGGGLFWEEEELLEGGKTVCLRCLFFWCGEFVLWVFGEPEAGGTGLLGVLGTGARISLRYPGAREPDRLLLAGREETRFWAVFDTVSTSALDQPKQRDLASEAGIFNYEWLSYFML